MILFTMMRQRLSGFGVLCLFTVTAITASPVAARTATYVAPASLTPGEIAAVSTANDNAGFLVGLNQTFAILFDQPFGLVRNADNVTIFTLAPPTGNARARVRFGVYNNGSPTIVRSRNIQAGNSISTGNLFQAGCAVLGGCDYIEITTTRTRRGATGVEVDYVDVNGEVTEIAAPTPEPSVWALMIMGFAGLAMRMKSLRGRRTLIPA